MGKGSCVMATPKDEIIIIKKYANRRLYNMQTSCYITLEDLRQMIKRGEEFIVHDAKTGEDLTRTVLTQIIFEQELKGYNLLPITFLRNLISLYDHNVSEFVPTYLDNAMNSFIKNQSKVKAFSPFEFYQQAAKQNLDLFEQTFKIFEGLAPSKKKE